MPIMSTNIFLPAISNLSVPSKARNPRLPKSRKWLSPISACSTTAHETLLAKHDLLELISDQERGLKTQTNPSKRSKIIKAIEAMAFLGKDSTTTDSSLSGTWRMLWTTEKEQLYIIKNAYWFGTKAGDVLQVIDVGNSVLNNVITFPPSGAFIVGSDIKIVSPQRVEFR